MIILVFTLLFSLGACCLLEGILNAPVIGEGGDAGHPVWRNDRPQAVDVVRLWKTAGGDRLGASV